MTSTAAPRLPRTARLILEMVTRTIIGDLAATVRWTSDTSFEVVVPHCVVEAESRHRHIRPLNVGQVSWWIEGGAVHYGPATSDVKAALDNIAEGRDPRAPRRLLDGTHTGRDRQGRFLPGPATVAS